MAILLSHRSGFAVLRGQISGAARARRHTDLVNGPGTTPPGDNPEEGNENLRGSVKKWSTRFVSFRSTGAVLFEAAAAVQRARVLASSSLKNTRK